MPRKPPKKLPYQLLLRYGEDERKALERHAESSRLSNRSLLVRRAILGLPPPEPPRPAMTVWDERAVAALGRIGNNINQIARRMHQDPSAAITPAEFEIIDRALLQVVTFTLGLDPKDKTIERLGLSQVAKAIVKASADETAGDSPGDRSP